MGIAGDLGIESSMPRIDITGLASSTWLYVGIVAVIGLILIIVAAVVFFMLTYNKKIALFENISGQGYQLVLKTRARIVKLGVGGEELLKTFIGGHFVSAYGRKMGRGTYWYAKGQDGYWYNIILGDLDAKKGMLDIEPIDRDVRLMHVALDRLAHMTYGKQNLFEKYGVHMMLFAFLILGVVGGWFLIAELGKAVSPLGESTDIALAIQEKSLVMIERLEAIVGAGGVKVIQDDDGGTVGLVPAGG